MLLARKRCPHAVGEIITRHDDIDPSTIWAGTSWEKIQGKFLFGSDPTHATGTTGGEATHTLTVDELPSHEHNAHGSFIVYDADNPGTINFDYAWNDQKPTRLRTQTKPTGGGAAHNNMPPFVVVNHWRRTA